MNILVVGSDTKGSWAMRGVQLGGAIGARVTVTPSASDWAWAELVVLVKRAAVRWRAEARRVKVPVVWDVLDFWAQPEDNDLDRLEMIDVVRNIQHDAGVTTLIGATRAMALDLGGLYLPHHCRLGLQPASIREKAEVVAYEGQRKYLGRWAKLLQQSCDELGLRFVINPPDIRDADVLVAFRDGPWDGWACQQWKSGIKHVNALVAGRPIVAQQSAAADEIKVSRETLPATVHDQEFLTSALRRMSSKVVRAYAYEWSVKTSAEYQLPAVARRYTEILQQVARRAA